MNVLFFKRFKQFFTKIVYIDFIILTNFVVCFFLSAIIKIRVQLRNNCTPVNQSESSNKSLFAIIKKIKQPITAVKSGG